MPSLPDKWPKRRRIRTTLRIAMVGLLFAVIQNTHAAKLLADGFWFETVADSLLLPTSVAFSTDGRIFIAQKNGVVRVVKNEVMLEQPFVTLTDVNDFGDRGLIGLALDPNFSSNGFVYLAYTFENDSTNVSGPKTARVVRLTADGDTAVEGSGSVILGTLTGSPAAPSCEHYPAGSDCIASDSASHTIGGLRSGADGKLYVSIGDGAGFTGIDLNAFRAQDLDNLSGKILRIETDGSAAASNPFHTGNAGDNRSKVWAYGFRNPYRFNLHPVDGRLLSGDVGWTTREEINAVLPGRNYGWPCREGTGPAPIGYTAHRGCPLNKLYQDPIYDYVHVEIRGAVTGGAFATSATYPSWLRGHYVFADFSFNTMQYLTLDEQSRVVGVSDLATEMAGPVEIVTGPDGLIYYLSIYRGELLRLHYTSTPIPSSPIAQASVTISEASPLMAIFDASGSSDPQGMALSYHWDFGDGNSGSEIAPVHTYASNGSYLATLTVTAPNGADSTTTVTVAVNDSTENDSKPYFVSLESQADLKYLGSPITFTAILGNDIDAQPFAALFEIFDGEDRSVGNILFESQRIAAGMSNTYNFSWLPVGLGHYYVSVGLYRDDWSRLIHPWKDHATEFDVLPRSPLTILCDSQFNELNDPCDQLEGLPVTPQLADGEPADNIDNWPDTGGIGVLVVNGTTFKMLVFLALFLKLRRRWPLIS